MREIKFRAWDKAKKKWINLCAGDYGIDCEGDVFQYFVNTGEQDVFYFDNVVLSQYIGLKDKKGQEIYETDIVKYKDYAKGHISKVIQNFRLGTGHYIKSPGIGFYSINERTIKDLEIEVIGNVFEDSHLLEEHNG